MRDKTNIFLLTVMFISGTVATILILNIFMGNVPSKCDSNYNLKWNQSNGLGRIYSYLDIESDCSIKYTSNVRFHWTERDNKQLYVEGYLYQKEINELINLLEKINFLEIDKIVKPGRSFPYNNSQNHIWDLTWNSLKVEILSDETTFTWGWDGYNKHSNYIVPDEVWNLQKHLDKISERLEKNVWL